MILTWQEIIKEVSNGNIIINYFDVKNINPNSYNYHLGSELKVFDYFDGEKSIFKSVKIPKEWMMLEKWYMYLWQTDEIIWSKKYMISLIGKSSIWRLGMFLQLSANVWHTWTCHKRTLEIYPTSNIIVYPHMVVWQVTFWQNYWDIKHYNGEYSKYNSPQESLLSN